MCSEVIVPNQVTIHAEWPDFTMVKLACRLLQRHQTEQELSHGQSSTPFPPLAGELSAQEIQLPPFQKAVALRTCQPQADDTLACWPANQELFRPVQISFALEHDQRDLLHKLVKQKGLQTRTYIT